VSRKYLEALEALEAANPQGNAGNTSLHLPSPTTGENSGAPNNRTRKNRKITSGYKDGGEVSEAPRRLADKTDKTTEAGKLGLVASWSREFGYVALRDPGSGEWHDLAVKDAPGWALWEARKRKELYRDGSRGAYRLTSREMEEIWHSEQAPESEGIVEDHPLEDGDS
jgi:hypothetical protein